MLPRFASRRRRATPSPFDTPARTAGTHPVWPILAVSLWLAGAGNLALWQALAQLPELQSLRGFGFSVVFGVVIAAGIAGLSALLGWRSLLKPVLSLLLLGAAFGGYFMLAYGVVIDSTMMVNVLQTDLRETRDLLNGKLALQVLVVALLPMALLWRTPVRRLGWGRQLLSHLGLLAGALIVLVLALLLIFRDFSSLMRNHTQLRYLVNPLNSVYALGQLAAKPLRRDDSVILPLGEDARLRAPAGEHPAPLLLLVVGETARAGNFGLNGYERDTTPELGRRTDLASWRNAWSCGTSTASSLPCMFSHLGREGFESRKTNHEGLLDVLQHAGLAVLWLDNQSGCKGNCDRVASASTTQLQDPEFCASGECHDEIMLKGLEQRIAALPPERRAQGVVVVLHQMGSHGPAYYKRTPAAYKRFQPECTHNALQECTREAVVNAYDNSIAYTDHFLAQAITWLERQGPQHSSALMYVSDHGESLGENNIYLHGLPYAVAPDVQKRVPWISWLSPAMQARSGVRTDCLRQRRDERLDHDHYFHSVLGLLGVSTSAYRPALDLFAPCAAGH